MEYDYLSKSILNYFNSKKDNYLEIISSFKPEQSKNRYVFNPEINKKLIKFIADSLSCLLKEEPNTLDELFVFKHYLRYSFLYFINQFESKKINNFNIDPIFSRNYYKIPIINDEIYSFQFKGAEYRDLISQQYNLIERSFIYTKIPQEKIMVLLSKMI